MPPLAPLIPRKMLPPPTTIAISTPRSARALVTSPAMRCTTSESMPNPIERSANASPESFSTTRRYLLSDISTPSGSEPTSGSETTRWSVFADLDPGETTDGCTAAEALDQRADRLLLILDERLLDE